MRKQLTGRFGLAFEQRADCDIHSARLCQCQRTYCCSVVDFGQGDIIPPSTPPRLSPTTQQQVDGQLSLARESLHHHRHTRPILCTRHSRGDTIGMHVCIQQRAHGAREALRLDPPSQLVA